MNIYTKKNINKPNLIQIFYKKLALHCITLYVCIMKNEMIPIRVDQDLKAKLKVLAEKDQRSLSDFIRLQLQKIAEVKK